MGTVPTSCGSNGTNKVRSIKTIGLDRDLRYPNGAPVPTERKQSVIIQRHVNSLQKGSNLSVTITNTHATDTQNFRLFDVCGTALAKGAPANGGNIEFVTTFAGGSSSQNTYDELKETIKGTHVGSLGTMFKFSTEGMIDSSNVTIWNGNFEDYNSKSLQNYLLLAEDTYANDPKILVMSTELWINNFLAISGSIPALQSLTILFNVVELSNF